MAESYRGLTIRIGGDTTKLNQALHSANQAISGTQSGLKKLSDALKMDPSSFKAAQLQVGAVAEQASNAAARIVTLNDAMRQVGDSVKIFNGVPSSVRELATSWGNVNMVASQTRDHYKALTETLATTYTEFSKTYSEASKMASIKVTDGWELGKTDLSDMLASLKSVGSQFSANKKQVSEFSDKITNLQNKYDKLTESYEKYQESLSAETDPEKYMKAFDNLVATSSKIDALKESFKSLLESFKGFDSKTLFKYDSSNTDLASLAKSLYQMVEVGAMTTEQADKMYDSFEQMKNMWEQAFENVKTANVVEGFHDLEAETEKATAKVTQLVNQMVELSNVSETAKSMGGLKEQFKEIVDRGGVAEQRLKAIMEIMKKEGNYNSPFLQDEAMRDFNEVIDQTRAAIKNTHDQIDQYDDSIKAMANSTRSYAAETAAANKNYKDAASALKAYEGAMAEIKELQDQVVEENPSDYADDERYQNLEQTYAAMGQVLSQLKANFADAEAEKKKFVEVGEVRTLYDSLEHLVDNLGTWSKAGFNVKPEVDTSGIEGMKKLLDEISKEDFSLDGLSKFREDVNLASTALSEAEKRFKALNDAAKKDPANADTLRMRAEALDGVIAATKQHIEAMKAELAAIPSDRVDHAAIAAGKVGENYTKAKKQVEDFKTGIIDLNKRIEALEKERKDIVQVNPEAKKRVNELSAAIDELKQRRAALAAAGDAAFDNLAIAENTRRVQENMDAIQQDTAALEEYGNTSRNMPADFPPKIDEAAFMQVIDRIAQAAQRVGQAIVQSSNEVDSAYRDMRKTVNGTEEEFESLKNAAMEFSQTHVTSTDTMLEMQALGGQLGVVTEDLQKFGEIGSNLDIATDMDAEDIALKLGQMSNVLQLDIDGMQGFSDALVRLGNNMPAQESSIMAIAQRFGAVASTANFSGQEVLAWAAAIAATGQRSEAAATAIGNTVSGIEQAIAGGGEELQQFAAIAGMSADQFEKTWKKGPTEALKAFINGLQTLNDSDESAVAALEAMGITGVRQQQTLLALSRTIDSLDEALVMSSNAWNGISDQWGQAGDAAIEAQKKSEGFSGALAILKNNAQNIAASMGDGMIPFMKLASSALELLTNLLNSMPAPIKSLVVGLGAASIAFSTLTPALKVFSGGLTFALNTLGKTSTIGGFIAAMTGFDKVMAAADGAMAGFTATMSSAEGATAGLAGVFSGPMVLGIGAAVAALTLAIGAIEDYNQKQQTLHDATYGLANAMDASKTSYDAYMSGAQESARSISELKDAINDTIEAQANLADEISSKWSEIGASEATVDKLVGRIKELAGQSSLTADEQKELQAAVSTFNNICGTNIGVVDAQNGKLSDSVSTIEDYAQAWKDTTESKQALEDYGNIYNQLAEDEARLAEVNAELEKNNGDWFTDYRDDASGASNSVAGLKEEQEKLIASISNGKEALRNAIGAMNDLDSSVAVVKGAFADVGDSLDNYGTFTDSELVRIVQAYFDASDKSVDALQRVRNVIDQLQSSAGTAAEIANGLQAASDAAINALYDKRKAEYAASYDNLKASLESEYNATKASYDAAYKAQQKAFDREYKAAQKAFDAEYKQAQKAFDKQYKQRQKEYEKQYKALKDKLDDEYKRRKEQYDKQLKALKKSQEAEVDAFKKATDAKLKDMEREYKQRLKMLELEYGGKTDDIDERIKALKNETEAEKKAIEERNEREKVADLQSAVEKAKSRRKRAEAEKALNDYLQEIEQKHNEETRNAEIERLEESKNALNDELEARKEALKEQYDAEVEAYKESRAIKLEALQEANTLEYETQKAHYDALLQALKDRNDAQLANLKERQTAELEAMKESQQAQLEAMKENQQAQLEAMKESQQASLESMKASQQAELENMKAANDQKLKDLKAAQDARLKAIKDHDADVLAEEAAKEDKLLGSNAAFGVALGVNASKIAADQHQTFSKMADDETKDGERGREGLLNALRQAHPEMQTLSSNLADAAESGPNRLKETLAQHGASGGESFVRSLSTYVGPVGQTAQQMADSASTPLSSFDSYSWGFDLGSQFERGMSDTLTAITSTADAIASGISSLLHFSVPDKGPLSDEDEWGSDLVQNLIDGMREREKDLYRQTEKMARIMEEGFDPKLSVDAAYEALDTINKNRSNAMSSVIEKNSAPNISINLNMNLSGVSIREDADIERLAKVMSQEMAAQAARQLAGRL